MAPQYVRREKAILKKTNGKTASELLWGDPVHAHNGTVYARGYNGRIDKNDLGPAGLLEVYVIDVGQGDGVLLRTPDDKWHLIDAGVSNSRQMMKRGVVNFLRWKFLEDLRQDRIRLQTVILTHPDFDHYGGLVDVFAGRLYDYAKGKFEDGRVKVEVENFYHNGLGRFSGKPPIGKMVEAESLELPALGNQGRKKRRFITELLDGKPSFQNPSRAFTREFAEFASWVAKVPKKVKRLTQRDQYLPGYKPGENSVAIRVLGPILEKTTAGPDGLRDLGSDSETVNGHSVVLRLDYGRSRTLLTGDLNTPSQKLLLRAHPRQEFSVDVAKACHHGSAHVDYDFLKAMQPRATVISSGDNEDYSHPQPLLIGASAMFGRASVDPDGALLPPLIYSTELARSTALAYADRLKIPGNNGDPEKLFEAELSKVKPDGRTADFQSFRNVPLATRLIYGLVNVRTDGNHVLCATMKETGSAFEVQTFQAGVNPP